MHPVLYFILLSILPLFYKLFFWLYVIQLKEYRCDRIKDYLRTPQGKKAVFNIFFRLEIIVLLLWIGFAVGYVSEKTIYYSLVFLLQVESLYVFYKIFSLKVYFPKFTKRMLILTGVSIITILVARVQMWLHPIYTYLILPKLLVFLPIIVLFWNAVTGIFFDIAKEKIFKKAENKIKTLNIKTIAITGSYGKSSTKEFLAKLLENNFNVIKTPKNINTEIWVSNFILNKLEKLLSTKKKNIFIAEAGAYSKWEISRMWKILNHQDGFLTGLGNQHLGLFGSQENLIEAKFEIWEKVLENNWHLYLNTSNIQIHNNQIKIQDKAKIVDFTWKLPSIAAKLLANNQIQTYPDKLEILGITPKGTKFKLNNEEFTTNIIWIWLLENLVWAIKYTLNQNVSLHTIKEKVKNLPLPDHTMKVHLQTQSLPNVGEFNILIFDDSYNLSTASLINAIKTIQHLPWKKLLILDDILELWKQAKAIHEKIGKYLADKIDEIIYVGVNYKQDIIKWLKKWNFKWKILDKLPFMWENYIILLEWRKSQKFKKQLNLLENK